MCRHVAYIGAPIALGEPLWHAPHALVDQARCPRLQSSGDSNPDGFGVAWYEAGRPTPHRYRTTTPMWEDREAVSLLASVTVPAFLATARLASPGAPIEVTGNAPFVADRWSFSLNGVVHGFHDGASDALRATLTPRRRDALEGTADSEVLFAMILDRLDRGLEPVTALAATLHAVERVATGRFNCILTDGGAVYATAAGNSLFATAGWVASEPLDEGDWTRVPDRSIVTIEAGRQPVVETL